MTPITIAMASSPLNQRALREFHGLGSSTRPAVKRIKHQAIPSPQTSLVYQGIISKWPWPPISLHNVKTVNIAIRNSKQYARRSHAAPGAGAMVCDGVGVSIAVPGAACRGG